MVLLLIILLKKKKISHAVSWVSKSTYIRAKERNEFNSVFICANVRCNC